MKITKEHKMHIHIRTSTKNFSKLIILIFEEGDILGPYHIHL